MVICSARNKTETLFNQRLGQGLGIFDNLLLIGLKLGLERFTQTNGLSRNDVLKRAALCARENRLVDLLGQLFLAQNHATTRAAQRFVRGSSDNVGIGNGVHVQSCCNQTGDVRHINHQVSANILGDFGKFVKPNLTRIRRSAGDNHFGLVLLGQLPNLIIINGLGLFTEAVGHDIVIAARNINRTAVRQMSAVGQIHAHDRIARLDQRKINCIVSRSTAMRLNIGMVGAKQFACALAGDILDHVNTLAPAVVTLAGIALGIFIGQTGPHRQHNSRADKVLRSNQLDITALPIVFIHHRAADLRVHLRDKFHVFFNHKQMPP